MSNRVSPILDRLAHACLLVTRIVALLAAAAAALLPTLALANLCATPAAGGNAGAISGVVNTYFPATTSEAAGQANTVIALGGSAGALTPIAVGDLLLIIQMQDATIDATNTAAYGNGSATDTFASGYTAIRQTGVYEFVRAASAVGVAGGNLTIAGQGANGGLVNAYNHRVGTDTVTQRRFQVIRVPQYATATVSGTVSALAWDGTRGGVVAIDVAARLTMAGGVITASGAGFRGGGGIGSSSGSGAATDFRTPISNAANGSKGEGIAGTPRYVNNGGTFLDNTVEGLTNGSRARGAPGNGGGGGTDGNPGANDQNTGGGGGGNAGRGGLGGHGWCSAGGSSCQQTGGQPGSAITELSAARITMGGGGGAGTTNNATGTPVSGFASSGAAGGGIVIVRAGEIAGSGSFTADGASANNTVTNDASGGGGAGGAILLASVRNVSGASLSARANGGNGGTNSGGGAPHGPGGGGGGGYVAASMPATLSASAGANGTTFTDAVFGSAYGSTAGAAAVGTTVSGASIPGLSGGGECTPTVVKSFSPTTIIAGMQSTLSVAVTNNNPTVALTGMQFTDAYPATIVNRAAPSPANSCSTAATLAAVPAGSSFAVSAATINAAATCTYTVSVTGSAGGSYTNTVPAGAITGQYGTTSTTSLEGTSAVLSVSAPLSLTKTSTVFSDPVNGTVLPKAIPGAIVTYQITVTNPGTVPIDNGSIVITDPTASELALFVDDIGAAGSGPVIATDGTPASGLTYSFGGLASLSDDISFSDDGGATWGFIPAPDGNGVSSAASAIRINPKGIMAAGTSFTVQFRYRIQ